MNSNKYIYETNSALVLKFQRLNIEYTCRFPLRNYPSSTKAYYAARKHRDEVFYSIFGSKLSTRYTLLAKKKTNKKNTFKGLELPNGISIGHHSGIPLYVVASYSTSTNSIRRKRFSIKKYGFKKAYLLAQGFRSEFEHSLGE